jgi:hypothetical protein
MLKRFFFGSLAVVATSVLAGFARDAHATDLPENGILQPGGITTVAALRAGAVVHRLIETDADQGGAVQIIIADCIWSNQVDVTLTENGLSDTVRFLNVGPVGAQQASITLASDASNLLPDASSPLPNGGSFPEHMFRNNDPNTTIQLCSQVGAIDPVKIQVQLRGGGDPQVGGDVSDIIAVRALGVVGPNVNAAVPGLPPWGMAGLGLLLTGMGVILVRRQRQMNGTL